MIDQWEAINGLDQDGLESHQYQDDRQSFLTLQQVAIAGGQMDHLIARLFDLGIEDPELLCDNDVIAFDMNENPEITVLQPIILENKDSDHDDDGDILPPKRSWQQANDALQILHEWNIYADHLTYEQ